MFWLNKLRRQRHCAAVIICLVLCSCASVTQASPPQVPNPPTTQPDEGAAVKEALKRYYVWGNWRPNLVPLDEVAYATEPEVKKWLAAYSEYARAERRLGDAARQRFDEQSLAQLQLVFPTMQQVQEALPQLGDHTLAKIDAGRVEVRGNLAHITTSASKVEGAIEVKKIDGRWKFPVTANLIRNKYPYRNAIEVTMQSALEEAALDDRLVKDLKAGRVTSVEQIKAAKAAIRKEIKPEDLIDQPQDRVNANGK